MSALLLSVAEAIATFCGFFFLLGMAIGLVLPSPDQYGSLTAHPSQPAPRERRSLAFRLRRLWKLIYHTA